MTLVLFFGEIVPSAFFTGPSQVEVAAKLVPMVKMIMFITSPVALPIAKLLDRVLHDDGGSNATTLDGTAHHEGGGGEFEEDVTEGNYYNRTELSALVRIQYESQLADKRRRRREAKMLLTKETVHASSNSSHHTQHHTHHSIRTISRELAVSQDRPDLTRMPSIHRDEITMIEGALAMTMKRAADVCTPLRCVYALDTNSILDEDKKVEIWARGYSRVPVYEPGSPDDDNAAYSSSTTSSSSVNDISSIVGVLLVRQLIVVDSAEKRPISTLPLVLPPCISPSMHLVDLINLFQASGGRGGGGLHLAVVCARPELATSAFERGESIPKEAGVVGIITLEDVVEELLQEEIYDETDRDLELSRWGVHKWKAFVMRKKMKRQQAGKDGTADSMTEATPLLESVVEAWQS